MGQRGTPCLEPLLSMLFIGLHLCSGTWMCIILHLLGYNVAYFLCTAPNHDQLENVAESEKIDYENMEWAECQVRASGNVMSTNQFFTKFFGGINLQIEHHLFPSLANHRLATISPIVKRTCKEFGIPYNSEPLGLHAIFSCIETYRRAS